MAVSGGFSTPSAPWWQRESCLILLGEGAHTKGGVISLPDGSDPSSLRLCAAEVCRHTLLNLGLHLPSQGIW